MFSAQVCGRAGMYWERVADLGAHAERWIQHRHHCDGKRTRVEVWWTDLMLANGLLTGSAQVKGSLVDLPISLGFWTGAVKKIWVFSSERCIFLPEAPLDGVRSSERSQGQLSCQTPKKRFLYYLFYVSLLQFMWWRWTEMSIFVFLFTCYWWNFFLRDQWRSQLTQWFLSFYKMFLLFF